MLSATPLDRSAAELDNDTQEHLAWAKTYRARILEVEGPRTIDNTLVPHNEMMMHLDAARWGCELFMRIHPDPHVREVAEEGEQAMIRYLTELKLDRDLHNAFRALDVSRADSATQYVVHRILRDFRRGGVDKSNEDSPGANKIEEWEKNYYEQLVKSEQYPFDPQSLRPYFNFPDVLQGLFTLTQKMFGITYRRVHGLNLWHETVTAWDVYDGKKRIGRFYLDPYARKNKYDRTAHFPYRTGIADVRLPQSVLVCNVPNPRDSKDGVSLMKHDEVVTLFHEFGRLLHHLFSGHRRWMGSLLNTKTARRFRRTVLEPGGSKKADELFKDFLGRPHSADAFKIWLDRT
ncbi:MAG: M3 family metallopeptidase [Phycisphaerae bacterium]